MAEPGEGLPEEVLALIFRHLSLRDRAAAARVCRAWAAAATCSAVWHDTKIRRPTRSVLDTLPPSLASTPLRTLQLRGPGAGRGRARARAGPQGTCPAHTRSRTGDFSCRTKKEIEGPRGVGLEPKSPTHLTPPHPT
ncbi:F-box and leucine rich repeat protein 8, partial [Homo sapiens]